MRGEKLHILILACSLLASCAGQDSVPAPLPPSPEPVTAVTQPPRAPEQPVVYRFPAAAMAPEDPRGDGNPGNRGDKTNGNPKESPPPVEAAPGSPPVTEEEAAARKPSGDEEKLRLALLQAAKGDYEAAERTLSGLRERSNRMVPYLDFFLRRQLGDRREAGRLLGQFVEEEKRLTGLVIERAELCTRIRRFRDCVPAESDRVKPGGVALLYVEPRNFALSRDQDRYILHLRYEWRLYDDRSVEHPVPAWERAPQKDREDRIALNGPVEEFYQSFALPLPADLAPGRYRIKVTVTDVQAGRSDRVYVPVTVAGTEEGDR